MEVRQSISTCASCWHLPKLFTFAAIRLTTHAGCIHSSLCQVFTAVAPYPGCHACSRVAAEETGATCRYWRNSSRYFAWTFAARHALASFLSERFPKRIIGHIEHC